MNDYIGFRVNPSLKKALEKLAEKDKRSLSNYIIMILEKHIEESSK